MVHYISIKQERQHGLEVFSVWCRGVMVGTFMSRAGAMTCAKRLEAKLNAA